MKEHVITVLVLALFISLLLVYTVRGRETGGPPAAIQQLVVAPEPERSITMKKQIEKLLSMTNVNVGDLALLDQIDKYQKLRVRWNAYVGAPAFIQPIIDHFPLGKEFIVLSVTNGTGRLPRLRSIELSSEQVFVAAINAAKELKAWSIIPDPRILRAESADRSGHLSGRVLHASQPEFTVAVPDDPEITELQFYHPNWTRNAFTLELLGTTRVR